ncbi:TPA: ribonuclease HII [bacterium]|nr:ribonuclease HII [bacterium]
MADMSYEKSYYELGYQLVAGTDEAGRGCLAGPLVVSAVIFPPSYTNPLINDSKTLTKKKRETLYEIIIKDALSYSIIEISNEDVDKFNIYEASKFGMIQAVKELKQEVDVILTDAMAFNYDNALVIPIIKGDSISLSIAAASILAKVHRDKLMDEYAQIYPGYDFKNNKGYVTKKHLLALEELGVTPIHRKTYAPVSKHLNKQLSFKF